MPMSEKHYRRYFRLWLAALLLFLSTAAIMNYLVDPYGLFGTARIEGFNAIKPTASTRTRMVKPYKVERLAPKTVISGNSRPEMGLDPANVCWPEELRPVYNLSLPGADIYYQARLLQHAISSNNVRFVLWGLDFINFIGMHTNAENPNQWRKVPQPFENRLRVNTDGSSNKDYRQKKIKDRLQALFSLDAMEDSLRTVFGQDDLYTPSIREDGFNPARDYPGIIAWEGQGVLFQQKNASIAKMFSRPGLNLFPAHLQWSPEFESVRQLLLYAQTHGVEVTLFINPYHADYFLSLDLSGHWQKFETWKKHLVKLTDEFGVKLFDFSGLTPFSTEPAPPLDDKETTLRWFWEPAHYRKEYGDLMLGQMLGRKCSTENIALPDAILSTETIDTHIIHSRRDMEEYKRNHPEAIKRLQPLLSY